MSSEASLRRKRMGSVRTDERRWDDLPWDALSIVFEKIGCFQILVSAQFVCRQWWSLSRDPRVWSLFDINSFKNLPAVPYSLDNDLYNIIKVLVDRADGCLLELINVHEFFDGSIDDLLKHVAKKNHKLRRLGLDTCQRVTEEGFMQACKSFPFLEELWIVDCPYIQVLSFPHSLRNLKIFHYDNSYILLGLGGESSNEVALVIAKNMSGLHELGLVGNGLDKDGMHAILDGCPLLQSLDVRGCHHLNFGDELKARCKGFTSLRLPSRRRLIG